MSRVEAGETVSKKKTFVADERETARVADLRCQFETLQQVLDVEDLVFVDESGCNTAMARTYGRSKRGSRAFGRRPGAYRRNMTIIGALGPKGMVAIDTIEGGMKKANFLDFLHYSLLPAMKPGQALVLDNLRSHHSIEAKALADFHGIALFYTPPYSPEYNPIEHAWAKMKNALRKAAARTNGALVEAVHQAANDITPNNAKGWTRHCGYRC